MSLFANAAVCGESFLFNEHGKMRTTQCVYEACGFGSFRGCEPFLEELCVCVCVCGWVLAFLYSVKRGFLLVYFDLRVNILLR